MPYLLHVDDVRVYLKSDAEASACRALILGAIRKGGDFVQLHHNPHRVLDILITQSTAVRIEAVDAPAVARYEVETAVVDGWLESMWELEHIG